MELARDLERRLAHLPGVTDAVYASAQTIAARARARLAVHRRTGAHRVDVVRESVDTLVELVGPAPLTLEYGRGAGVDEDGRQMGAMEPLAILRGAL